MLRIFLNSNITLFENTKSVFFKFDAIVHLKTSYSRG